MRRGVPRWFTEEIENASPCDCDADPETVRSGTGFSDSGFYLKECPECEHRWGVWIEG